jgi:hypothetical protein
MTTEIAVANRLGIALASDSAVTISGGGRVKIFDTADKLFELSPHHPIAVMINGNMDCLGIPWEILVKDFREAEGLNERDKTTDWTRDFLSYVEGHMLISEESIAKYVGQIVENEIDFIQSEVSVKIRKWIFEESGGNIKKLPVDRMVLEEARDRLKFLLQFPVADSLADSRSTVVEIYTAKIEERLVERFSPQKLTVDLMDALKALAIEALLRAIPSDYVAGVVVAGYGCKETFPTVHAVEVAGRVAGKLKFTEIESKSIITSMDGGQVISFAQTDVIQRLLEGADPRFIETTADFIEIAIKKVADAIETALRPRSLSKKKTIKRQEMVQEIVDLIKKEYEEVTAGELKEQFSREFDRMVAMMPKQELIELAEALVSITAVERKATSDEGTVGGLIDVAFITKHEGFVWIKRKHYFPPELNPTYFWRKYATPPKGVQS